VHHVFPRHSHEVLNYRLTGRCSRAAKPNCKLLKFKRRTHPVVPPKHPLAKRKEVDVADLKTKACRTASVESPSVAG
jgi:hypothetical protein